MTGPDLTIAVQAGPGPTRRDWEDLAVEVESLGLAALYVADHPGVTAEPFAALASAASVTTTLRLGTYVLNTGVRDPLAVASGAATVDLVSEGRMVLGLGAGHTPAEWTMIGQPYPSGEARVARLAEFVHVLTRLLDGEEVTFHGRHLRADGAFLLAPRPRQARIPLLIGGNGLRLLRVAAGSADVISLTGLNQTLEDGHRHAVDWRLASIDERVRVVREEASTRRRSPQLDVLVQHLEITDRAEDAAARTARMIPGATAADVLDSPYVLIGSLDEIVEQVRRYRDRWGVRSYVVRRAHRHAAGEILERLRRA